MAQAVTGYAAPMDWNSISMTQPHTAAELGHAGALLTIDLDAIRSNYRLLRDRTPGAVCSAVVKADGYGLGAAMIARALAAEGCTHFIVAHLAEAIALRPVVPNADIIVLHGPTPGSAPVFDANRIIPVLNSPQQMAEYSAYATITGRTLPALLQVDSGMSRFGLTEAELDDLLAQPAGLAGIELRYVMSHLACADTPAHPANAAQLACFNRLRARLPGVPASLSASSGIFLGTAYHFDLVRPGAALYGIAPQNGRPNPLAPVVTLHGRVMQTRTVPTGAGIGYGHTEIAQYKMRLATVAVGYADGFLRSSKAVAWFGETRLRLVGRVSMDSIILDTTGLAEPLPPDALVELIGPHHDIDAAATAAGTIGYELLTNLGPRYARRILGA